MSTFVISFLKLHTENSAWDGKKIKRLFQIQSKGNRVDFEPVLFQMHSLTRADDLETRIFRRWSTAPSQAAVPRGAGNQNAESDFLTRSRRIVNRWAIGTRRFQLLERNSLALARWLDKINFSTRNSIGEESFGLTTRICWPTGESAVISAEVAVEWVISESQTEFQMPTENCYSKLRHRNKNFH